MIVCCLSHNISISFYSIYVSYLGKNAKLHKNDYCLLKVFTRTFEADGRGEVDGNGYRVQV